MANDPAIFWVTFEGKTQALRSEEIIERLPVYFDVGVLDLLVLPEFAPQRPKSEKCLSWFAGHYSLGLEHVAHSKFQQHVGGKLVAVKVLHNRHLR